MKLKDIGKIVTGKTPSTKQLENFSELDDKYLFVTPRDMKNNCKYIESTERYLTSFVEDKFKSQIIKKDSVCISCIGSDMGKVYMINRPGITNQQINSITDIKDICNPHYLYYYFSDKKEYLKRIAGGSTMPILNKSTFENIEIDLPARNIQDKIVKILNNIDNKIELNNQTNDNLYAIGKALYQEYFENEKYMSNYETKQLSDVTTNNRNKIDQSKEYKVLSAVNTGNLVLSDDYFNKQVYSKDIGKYLNVNKYDFAYNPARINIGSIGLNTFDFNCCVSPVYVTFSVDKDYIDFFDFYFKSKKFNAEVTLRASGSVRQALNYNDFGMIEIPYPTKEMIDNFNNSYKTLKERININKIKIRNLEQLRDTLLPKLMNGEIDLDRVEI